jgi:hypothetical protein
MTCELFEHHAILADNCNIPCRHGQRAQRNLNTAHYMPPLISFDYAIFQKAFTPVSRCGALYT